MAKRFIDTDLFRKPSFRKLPVAYKTLWVYVICECNHAGIWNVELDVAGLRLGDDVPSDAAEVLGDMIHVFDGGKKWWVKDFVRFQYGSEMVTGNRMHLSVMRELEKHGLMDMLDDVTVVEVGTTVSAMRSRLSKKAKNAILLRDELTCQYCQQQKPMAELVVDHVHPLFKGGDNADDNLVACCVRCNGHKTDMELSDFLAKKHPFLNPTTRVDKILEGAFKPLQGDKDKDKDKAKDKDIQGRKDSAKPKRELVWPSFAGEKVKAKWSEFIAYRIREKKQRYQSVETEQKALDLVAKYFTNGPDLVDALDHTMARTWVFPVDPTEHKYPHLEKAATSNGVPAHLKDPNRKIIEGWQPLT